jgi:hypothetical protein
MAVATLLPHVIAYPPATPAAYVRTSPVRVMAARHPLAVRVESGPSSQRIQANRSLRLKQRCGPYCRSVARSRRCRADALPRARGMVPLQHPRRTREGGRSGHGPSLPPIFEECKACARALRSPATTFSVLGNKGFVQWHRVREPGMRARIPTLSLPREPEGNNCVQNCGNPYDSHTAVLFSPPRDGFSIPDDLWQLLI